MRVPSVSRRQALQAFAAFVANSPLLFPQQDPFRPHARIPALREMNNAFDFEPVCFAKISRTAYNYTAQGTDSEFTLRRNREAFDWVELLPKRIGNAEAPNTAIELFGQKMAFPLMVSPTAAQVQLHADAETGMQNGAAAANTPMIVSNNSSLTFEKIATGAKTPLWAQLYPKQSIEIDRTFLEGVQAAGAKAIVVTIDQQAAVYERQLHDRNFTSAATSRFGNSPTGQARVQGPYGVFANRLWYEWKFFDQIRPFVKVPILAKGVITPEDAKLCLEHGVDGIYVSNHGGRSLDYGPSTLEVLPEIVDAVNGKVPVIFDSGVRRGTDIVKALALGANAVCLGRVPRWGLGAYGAPGVQRVLEILQAETVQAMQMVGAADVKSLNRNSVLANFR